MTRVLTTPYIAEKDAVLNQPVFLVEIQHPGGIERFSSDDVNTVFQGDTYTALPMDLSDLEEEMSLETGEITLTFANLDRYFSILANDYELRGSYVTILLVFRNIVSYPDAYIAWSFAIDTISFDEKICNVGLTSRLDIMNRKFPPRTYSDKCPWRFKSSECGYVDTPTDPDNPGQPYAMCPKTVVDCEARDRLRTFGGFTI